MVSSLWGIEIGFDEKSATHCRLVSSTSTKSIGLPSGVAIKMLNVEEVRVKEWMNDWADTPVMGEKIPCLYDYMNGMDLSMKIKVSVSTVLIV